MRNDYGICRKVAQKCVNYTSISSLEKRGNAGNYKGYVEKTAKSETIIDGMLSLNYNRSGGEQTVGGVAVRIAICYDEKAIKARQPRPLMACEACPNDTAIFDSPDGVSLIDAHKNDPFDIIFLDVQTDLLCLNRSLQR